MLNILQWCVFCYSCITAIWLFNQSLMLFHKTFWSLTILVKSKTHERITALARMTKVKNHLLVSFVTKNPMLFNHILCAKLIIQIRHLCGFLPSWTFAICLFKSTLNAKLDSQMLHLCALFFKSTLCFSMNFLL